MTTKTVFLGYEVGTAERVEIPIWHTLIAGTTQLSGKTTLLRAMAKKAVDKDFKILVFDAKSNYSDYSGFGEEVPICLRETTDSLTILALLESIMSRKLTPQYATLSRVSENAKDFTDVLANTENLIENSRGFTQDCARTLRDLMKRLIEQTKGRDTTPNLQLPYAINRISINNFSLEGQQMVIKTALEDALKFSKLIVIVDELSKFTPQRYRSACQIAINHYVTQGAITEDFFWGSTQFLATTSKDAMKAMDVKILGRQSHDTECEHTLDLIPTIGKQKFTTDSIMQLKVGHFVVVAENWVKTVYTCPENAVKSQCMQVALGKREPSDLQYSFLLTQDDVKKLKAKDEVVTIEKDEVVVDVLEEESVPLTVESTTPKIKPGFAGKALPVGGVFGQRIELVESNIEALRQRIIGIEKQQVIEIEKQPKAEKKLADITSKLSNCEGKIEKCLLELTAVTGRVYDIEKAAVVVESTALENIKNSVQVRQVTRYKTVTDESTRGKIMLLASTGFFNTWHPLREVVKAFEDKPWTAETPLIKKSLQELVKEFILASKQQSREYLYKLSPNVVFEDPHKEEEHN